MEVSIVALDSSSSADECTLSTVSNSLISGARSYDAGSGSGCMKHRVHNSRINQKRHQMGSEQSSSHCDDDSSDSPSNSTCSSSGYFTSDDEDSDSEYFASSNDNSRRSMRKKTKYSTKVFRINKEFIFQVAICLLLFTIMSNSYSKRMNKHTQPSANHDIISKKSKAKHHLPKRIFMCGLFEGANDYTGFGMQIMRSVLPELDEFSDIDTPLVNIEDIDSEDPSKNDILVYYLHADCVLDADDFPGWTVFFSGEFPHLKPKGERVLYLGPNASGPRSIRTTYLQMFFFKLPLEKKELITNHSMKVKNNKKYFLLYAASNCVDFREKALDQISEIEVVHQGGKCWGAAQNRDRVIEAPEQIDRMKGANGNDAMFANYRFALVMENTFAEGYMSEKILNAFMGGTIPIWYGSKEVFKMFNKNAFIYFDVNSPTDALDRIKDLEKDPKKYQKMLNAPILAGDADETIQNYFSYSDDIGGGFLKKEIRYKLGYGCDPNEESENSCKKNLRQ